MIRILILASLGAVIDSSWISSHLYPRGLESLFGTKREVSVEKRKEERTLCESEECKLIAKVIKEGMDESVDPCDDFYEYACGQWSKNNPAPENVTSWSLWDMAQKEIGKQVGEIIETDEKPNDLFAVKLAKSWYRSCMDEEAQKMRGVEPLLSTLWRHGGWPLIMEDGEWDDVIYNWQIVDDQFARLMGLNAFHDLRYDRLDYEGNDTILIDTPHLPPHMYRLLSYDSIFSVTDSSDENNESGEGSQEAGSKEKGSNKKTEDDEDEEDSEDDEESGENEENEDSGEDEEEKKLRKTKIAGRRSHKRLGHGRRRSNRNKVARERFDDRKTRKRTKRDIMKAKVLHRILRKQKKHAKHRIHHSAKKTKGGLSKHGHLSVANHVKTSTKENHLKHEGKKESSNNNVAHSKKVGGLKDDDKDTEKLKKLAKKKINKRLGHGKRKHNRNKALGKHVDERKMNKSKRATMKASVQNNKHHRQRKIGNHRVHHVAKKVKVAETEDTGVSSNDSDDENEDSHDNEVDTEGSNDESGIDSEDNEVDNEDTDEDSGNVSDDNDEDDKEQDSDSTDEDDSEDSDEEGDSNDEDDEEEDDDDEDEDEEDIEELKETYRDYILNVSLVLSKARGIEVPRERLEKGVADLVEFAIKLGELTLDSGKPEDATLDSFQESYDSSNSTTHKSKVNWKRKVQKLFDEAGVDIDDDVELVVGSPTYFEKLHSLLDETPSKTIVNYVHWLFISKMAQFATPDLVQFAETWYGHPYYESRAEQCIEQVEMTQVTGYEYVRKHFSENVAKTARDMIDDIQKEVEYRIKESTWMNDETQHFILDKLVNMKNLVGYPNWYQNTTAVKHYFQGLTIGPSYYENTLNYIRYQKWKSLREILGDDTELDELDPLMLNAFFMPTENSIAVTAADFQNPLFALNRPWNVNYGIIGVVMAHEVNHGFDDNGHLYDREGKPMEWLSAMAAAYDKRAECFVHQFNKYSIVKGENFTVEDYGNQTAGENIADTMGLQAVFKAYQRRERECVRPDPALPGLEKFSNDQTFFLSFANLWCESVDPDSLKRQAKYDVHSTGRLRVIGSVSNSEDFAKAFNCPVGSPMNPEKKCNIWI